MIRPARRNKLPEFNTRTNFLSALALAVLFILGFFISLKFKTAGIIFYIASWILSYIILFAGTCRNCVYYGKRCPVPLEGSCVSYFFDKKEEKFGFMSLIWAGAAYSVRVAVPVYIIFRFHLVMFGITYFSAFALFWIIHLRYSGCPNCINIQCPLNPK
jgi:hypothetical protein